MDVKQIEHFRLQFHLNESKCYFAGEGTITRYTSVLIFSFFFSIGLYMSFYIL